MIEFRVNTNKTIAAILFVIREANGRGARPTQYDLVKTLFLSDRAHLNKYGRPVTFDRYVAMTHGPVPSFAYNSLKSDFVWPNLGFDRAPWQSTRDGSVHRFSLESNDVELSALSESDKKELGEALSVVLSLSFSQLRRLTHEDRAYVSAWRDEEDRQAFPMDMGLLLEDADQETLDDIQYLAQMSA